jgi:hypothetical protein
MSSEEKMAGAMPTPPFPMPDPSEFKMPVSKSDVKAAWEKSIDRQKSNLDASKDQYIQFFGYMSDMLDSFADALPEELPGMPMPSWVKPPKSVRKEMKEWEQMANDFFVEITDQWADFVIQSQEKACGKIPEAEEKAEVKDDVIETKAEVVEEKPAAKSAKAAK